MTDVKVQFLFSGCHLYLEVNVVDRKSEMQLWKWHFEWQRRTKNKTAESSMNRSREICTIQPGLSIISFSHWRVAHFKHSVYTELKRHQKTKSETLA